MLAQKLSKTEQLDETILLRDIVRGDYKAFTLLYETHVAQLTNYAFKFTNDVQVIEDCLHDLFVWLWNNKADLKITHSLKAYLFKCVRTSLVRTIEKSKKVISFEDADNNSTQAAFVSSEQKYIDTESYFNLKEKMTTVLSMLTSKQKEVIYLRFYQGLSFDDIAINMNLSTKACYKLMGRAISELRKTSLQSWQYFIIFFLFFF